jgi:hypothetical protein
MLASSVQLGVVVDGRNAVIGVIEVDQISALLQRTTTGSEGAAVVVAADAS